MLFSLSPSVLLPSPTCLKSPRALRFPRGQKGQRNCSIEERPRDSCVLPPVPPVSTAPAGVAVHGPRHLTPCFLTQAPKCTREEEPAHPHGESCFFYGADPLLSNNCHTVKSHCQKPTLCLHSTWPRVRSGLSSDQWGSFSCEKKLLLGERVNCRSGFKQRVEIGH